MRLHRLVTLIASTLSYITLLSSCQISTFTTPPQSLPTLITPATQATPNLSSPTPVSPIPPSSTKSVVLSPTPPADTGWQTLQPGLERRLISLFDGEGRQIERLYLVRLEPEVFRFAIAYHPGQPMTLPEWQTESDALVVVNGGFFTPEFLATGLIIVDGQASGTSYQGFGGMLAITSSGPELRSLVERPYDPAESFKYALQSFPMLVNLGGQLGYAEEDGATARRTAIAQDRNGRILFIIAPWGSFTLHQLGSYLLTSDLDIDIALNLDGGTSTGLLLAEPTEGIPAYAAVPAVITIHAR